MDLRDGVPVTSVSRTLLDLAAEVPSTILQRFVERTEQLKLLDLRPIDSLLIRVPGHPGARRLRSALALYRPDGRFTRSELERYFIDLLRERGLSLTMTNCFIEGYEIDAYWPRERFAVELDTYEFHGSRAAFERDRLRHEDLTLAGIEMIRVTGHRLESNPDEVIERLTKLLDQRRRQLS